MAIDHEPTAAPGPGQHDIGPRGTIVVAVEADDVRIRGVAGTTARVVAPAGGAGLETTAEPGRFVVRSGRAARFATFGLRIGGHGIGMTIAGTIELEVPQDARVEVHATAGDVAIRDVRGGVSVKTASGDVSIKRTAGEVTASLASGDLHVEAVAPVRVEARSVAGDVRIRAPRFDLVAIETVSGDVELVGAFGPGVDHAISTISGDVELGLAGGLTLSSKSVSGDVDCRHPDRRSGDGRRQPLVVGDGAARLAVRSMSGDVKVRTAPAPGPSVAPTPPAPPVVPTAASTPPVVPTPPIPPVPTVVPTAASTPPVVPTPSTGPAEPSAMDPRQEAPTQPAPARSAPARSAAAGDPTLDVLEALARGEIDVLEAERRLGAMPDPAATPPQQTGHAANPVHSDG